MNSKLLEQKTEKHQIQMDGCRDLLGSWCCRRSERYGRRPVCKALKVKVASLNRIRHSTGSQWTCLRRSFDYSGDVRECWYKTTRAAACWIRWRRAVLKRSSIQINWSRREEMCKRAKYEWLAGWGRVRRLRQRRRTRPHPQSACLWWYITP